jgi:hypothetical protein
MTDRLPLSALSDSELEQRLVDLGPRLYPPTPDLAMQVRHRLESEPVSTLSPTATTPHHAQRAPCTRHPVPGPVREERGSWPHRVSTPFSPRMGRRAGDEGVSERRAGDERRSWAAGLGTRRLWLVAALLLIALVSGLVLFPEARNAIADRLGLQGVSIRWVDEVPTPEPSRVGAPLLLGRPVTLDEAQAAVDFPVRIPTAAGFNAPNEIYLLDQDNGAMVSFVYPAGPGLPATNQTGVGALLTQFRGEADRGLIEKGLSDDAARATHLQAVAVSGEPGFWISGAPHGFFVVCYDVGECREERYRLAGNVLLWEQDGVTLRLESAFSLKDALAIAESVPAPD